MGTAGDCGASLRITIIPCGFDPKEFWPISKQFARIAIGLPPNERVILQLGRMVPRKGVDTVIRGLARDSRGALWTGTSRPPHHSPQYNLLIGSLQPGYLNGTENFIGPHGLNTNGCVQCHVVPVTVANPTDQNPSGISTARKYSRSCRTPKAYRQHCARPV